MKRLLADTLGNYIVFVPLVLLFSRAWTWDTSAVLGYLTGAVLVSSFGGPFYAWFLKHLWYPLWKIQF